MYGSSTRQPWWSCSGRRRTMFHAAVGGFVLLWMFLIYNFFSAHSVDPAHPPLLPHGQRQTNHERGQREVSRPASAERDLPAEATDGNGGFLHVITQYPVLKEHLDRIASKGTGDSALQVAAKNRQLRQTEYTDALLSNALHPAVRRVHLLLENDEDEAFIIDQIKTYPFADLYEKLIPAAEKGESSTINERIWRYIQANQRIRFVKLRRWLLYSDAFGYARKHLPGHACVIQNGDISLSLHPTNVAHYMSLAKMQTDQEGRSRLRLDPAIFTTPEGRKKVFVLSRSTAKLPTCETNLGDCRKSAQRGSYDTYIFESPLPEILEWQVPMPQNIWGAESRVLWAMKCLNISVTNPCVHLATIHHHCQSTYRPGQQEDPPNIPKVKYTKTGAFSFPVRAPAESVYYSMKTEDFPDHESCHLYPWNGPEAVSDEAIAAAAEAVKEMKMKKGPTGRRQ